MSSSNAGRCQGEKCSKPDLACCSAPTERIAKVAPTENRCMLENVDESVDYVHLTPPTGISSDVSCSAYIFTRISGNKWLSGRRSSGVFMGQETWDVEPAHALQFYPSCVVLRYYFDMWRWIINFTVGSKFRDLFNEGKWLLLPEPHILDLYLRGRCNPMSVPPKTSVRSIIFELSIIWDSPLAGTILQVHRRGTKWHGFSPHHMPHYRRHGCHDGANALISISTPRLHTLPSSPSLRYLPRGENGIEIFGVQRTISKVQSHFWKRAFLLRILDCQNRQPQNDG